MPVYNAELYVAEAIQSILEQTFTDFEFIIVNDGSTDRSFEIIQSFNDKRIKLINNDKNIGNYPSRNKGHRMAKGNYICVMDADDVSLPNRLERQYMFMEDNPDVGIAGSSFRIYGSQQDIICETEYELLKVMLLCNNPMTHSSLLMRRSMLQKYNLFFYNERYYYAADYYMISQAVRFFRVTNIPEVLIHYRTHAQQITSNSRERQNAFADDIALEQLKNFEIETNEAEKQLHLATIKGKALRLDQKDALWDWKNKLIKANQIISYYKSQFLEHLFDALFTKQHTLFKEIELLIEKPFISLENKKIDLTDVTFIFPLRVDSNNRITNMNTVLKILDRTFITTFFIIESDKKQLYYPIDTKNKTNYQFIYDEAPFFYHTHIRNQMLKMANTPYVAVWDVDIIALPCQIIQATELLRIQNIAMVYPYDGRVFALDKLITNLFQNTLQYEMLSSNIDKVNLYNGYHSNGGAFVVNRETYLKLGGENESIYGWGPEDAEREKRMEILDFAPLRISGPLFHLWHPRGVTSGNVNKMIEKNNRKIFLKTCSSTKNELSKFIHHFNK